jgi:cyclomaltodextrinase
MQSVRFFYDVLLLLCVCATATIHSVYAQSVPVIFRISDPSRQYVRAFVPGEFNNWGPNAGGVISAGASSEMQYDSVERGWKKTIILQAGQRYLYKFHFHRNVSGSQGVWISDPANDILDGSSNQNSVVQVQEYFVFQPSLDTNAQGRVTTIQCSVVGTIPLSGIRLVIGQDTVNALTRWNEQERRLRFDLATPQNRDRSFAIIADNTAGIRTTFRFLSRVASTPLWARDAMWYQIFPERFRNGDRTNDPTRASLELNNGVAPTWSVKEWGSDWFGQDQWERDFGTGFYKNSIFHRRYGGDLQGVLDRLDYLQDLGVTALYFNPLFYANSLHKYDGNSYHHIDPYFGPNPQADIEQIRRETDEPSTWRWTSADSLFLRLLQETKRRNMKVILDGVWNHTGRGFFAFDDILRNQASSRYKDWYTIYAFDNPATPQNEFRYKAWENFESLPELARSADGRTIADAPRRYIFNATRRWMDPNGDGNPNDGIDGWRLDVVPYAPLPFWNEWNAFARSINPDIYTTAEIWFNASDIVRNGNFSAVMNYWAFLFPVQGFFVNRTGTANSFAQDMNTRRSAYDSTAGYAMQNLMDSHDTERLASLIMNNTTSTPTQNAWSNRNYNVNKPSALARKIQRLITMFQMTYVGAPMIYYGTESGVWGGNDPDDRSPMNWEDIPFVPQALHPWNNVRGSDDMNFDRGLFQYHRQLMNYRKNSDILRRGSITFEPLTHNDVFVMRRSLSDRVYVAFNRGANTETVSIPIAATALRVIAVSDTLPRPTARIDNGQLTYTLPPFSGIITEINTVSSRSSAGQSSSVAVVIYPQPVGDEAVIRLTIDQPQNISLEIVDVLGRKVSSMTVGMLSIGTHDIALTTDHLTRGTYHGLIRSEKVHTLQTFHFVKH